MIQTFSHHEPDVRAALYISAAVVVIGQVTLGKGVSLWPAAVLRADVAAITLGDEKSNIVRSAKEYRELARQHSLSRTINL